MESEESGGSSSAATGSAGSHSGTPGSYPGPLGLEGGVPDSAIGGTTNSGVVAGPPSGFEAILEQPRGGVEVS